MVSGTSIGSAIDKSYQMEITTVDFATHGLNLTSALRTNFADTVQRTTKDAIKRKLTARVSPMTRQTEEVYDPRVYPQVSAGKVSHRSYDGSVKSEGKNSAATACSSRNQSSQKRLTEKRKSPATNVIIPSKTVNSDSLYTAREGPSAKRHRTILPRTNLSQVPEPETPKTPMSPEPKLMSLLSASECHLAALQDEDGDTPLHIAIAHGNTQLIEYLVNLMQCLTLDIYNNLKQTPLHLAVITEQAHTVGKLIAAGANANMPDRNGHTPTHLACQRSRTDCLEQLFSSTNKVDLEFKNFNGFTPLHEAVFAGCTSGVRCLVAHGANVNCKDGKSGRTPLHHAVESENIDVIRELLNCGADPSEPAFSGNTPLQIASGRGMQNVRQLFESNTRGTSGRYKGIPHNQASQVMVPNYDDSRHVILKTTYA